ncbi:hypothetical protein OHAE_2826 [Ochrobactrum soli]|uniref:Uncharacterized protein n=1 Tax=Ochrobactrum soli TaxID=2448455 RepID=A0A2P9HFL5_9HYPH|nr:hypothetical protein OHAE_2826 [[Ochrobactrum] soli]
MASRMTPTAASGHCHRSAELAAGHWDWERVETFFNPF